MACESNLLKPEFKWPVVASQHIAAHVDKVWEVISMPGNLEACHPFCSSNPVQVWPGDNSHDEVHYLSGWIFERQFCHWIDGVGYDLEIGRHGGQKSFVSWRIMEHENRESVLRIAVYPHVFQNVPIVIRWIPYIFYVRPLLKRYLSSVVKGFEWYIIRGESVPRNQFGSHPWFSTPNAKLRAT